MNETKRFSDQVIYQDHHIMVIHKPAGMPAQEDKTNDRSIWNQAQAYSKLKLHLHIRLDRPVSGLVLFSKKESARKELDRQMNQGEIVKKYLAVVSKKEFDTPIKIEHYHRKDGKNNKAYCSVDSKPNSVPVALDIAQKWALENYDLLDIEMSKGKFHQIRAQLATFETAIKGDVKYGARRKNKDRSIHLHAYELSFKHPSTKKELSFKVKPSGEDGIWKYIIDQKLVNFDNGQ